MFDHDSSLDQLGVLCKIKLSDEEKKSLGQSLKKVLDYMALLDEVDTEGVPPCTTILETTINVMDEDIQRSPFDLNIFFQNVPEHVGRTVKVPPVIEFES